MQNPSAKICLKNHGKRCQIELTIASKLIKIRPKSIQKASMETDLGEQSSRKRPGANYSCFTGVLKPPSLNYSCFIGVLRQPSSIYSCFTVFFRSPRGAQGSLFNIRRRPVGGYRGVLSIFIQHTETNTQKHYSTARANTHLGARGTVRIEVACGKGSALGRVGEDAVRRRGS